MLSQNVAKTTVPSYYHIRTNLPHRKPQNQWEGVYYFSGVTKRQQHVILLQRKREREAAVRAFQQSRSDVLAAAATMTKTTTTKAHENAQLFSLAVRLADHGLATEASSLVQTLRERRALQAGHYAALIDALQARRLQRCLLDSDAMGDPALVFKLVGDCGGGARAAEAYDWHDMAVADLRTAQSAARGGGVDASQVRASRTQLTNALMRALLTCGYTHVSAVPAAVYDGMGAAGVAPTVSTYGAVTLALALRGDTRAAEDIVRFLQARAGAQLTIAPFNALMLGHREAKAYDRCDALWQSLVDRRWPRAEALTAELYLRSIIDHSYAPTSEPLQRFGSVSVVEKKKVPGVLAQLDDLGIPRTHLSRPLTDELEDALRKYSIYRSRFYEWGRAVKQFDFIEFRRRHGWLYDLHLMKDTTRTAPPLRDPFEMDGGTPAPAATAELPAFFSERQSWERQALESLLTVGGEEERTGDVRSGDIYLDNTRLIHERSPTWMNEVPQTRYDQLYGVSSPDVAKIGIRRHLDVEYQNRQEVLQRDAAVTRKALSKGRRFRHRAELARTHREEGRVPASSGGGGNYSNNTNTNNNSSQQQQQQRRGGRN